MMKADDIEEILNNKRLTIKKKKKKYVDRIEKNNYFKKNSIKRVLIEH